MTNSLTESSVFIECKINELRSGRYLKQKTVPFEAAQIVILILTMGKNETVQLEAEKLNENYPTTKFLPAPWGT